MSWYVSKQIAVSAWRLGSEEAKPSWYTFPKCGQVTLSGNGHDYLNLHMPDGKILRGERGDWLVRGATGELKFWTPDEFMANFLPA